MKSTVVVGFGSFGKLFCEIFKNDLDISVIDNDTVKNQEIECLGLKSVAVDTVGQFDFVVLCVPISSFEETVRDIAVYVSENQIIMDICSVKVMPANAMKRYLSHAKLIATHPMFGPESAAEGLSGLKMALCKLNCDNNEIEEMWRSKGVDVIGTTPEDHDKDAAYSQALTYVIARFVNDMKMPLVKFETRSFQKITEMASYSANDSERLYHDMIRYNPFASEAILRAESVFEETITKAINYLTD